MTLITPEKVALETEGLLASVQDAIRELRQELEDLKKRVRAGDGIDATRDGRTVASANQLLTTCLKVETSLAECRNKTSGIAQGGYALDLDRARVEIGCQLDRLRCTAPSGTVPE
ncbi:hypothetical protein [Sulfitobacter sabulilitoris]|uniref:Uncharacterized protein n=1 Tax=Sulfitobacter sabulilitoris TaxID=2562655 RepID=A0A5S3PIS8_9RHOB|nr:hypothetical protein [Sulfitobacter sabulilitoris]TMM54304.1 hypothetical protein FDT80_01525 [Sulfitobacter sabulilitoris]